MKYLYLILLAVLFSCNNKSGLSQKQLYQDSARMCLDSMDKYKPIAIVDDESARRFNDSGQIMQHKYNLYSIMRGYYLEKAGK